ncbi:MAG TPA: hypothetical protein VEG84_05885 [Thermoanaerobaculia bacterium]|nr:hypothetical protein [Thermoanaerobaculia bacterium]
MSETDRAGAGAGAADCVCGATDRVEPDAGAADAGGLPAFDGARDLV